MAKTGTANMRIAIISEAKNLTLQLSVHKLCQWKDPTVAWILLENENLTSLRQVYAKNSQSLNVTSLCPALVSGF